MHLSVIDRAAWREHAWTHPAGQCTFLWPFWWKLWSILIKQCSAQFWWATVSTPIVTLCLSCNLMAKADFLLDLDLHLLVPFSFSKLPVLEIPKCQLVVFIISANKGLFNNLNLHKYIGSPSRAHTSWQKDKNNQDASFTKYCIRIDDTHTPKKNDRGGGQS